VKVTSSFGVMMLTPGMADAAGLIDEADKALYISKNSGRNRVTCGGARPESATV
jgi:diguanylate cyclase